MRAGWFHAVCLAGALALAGSPALAQSSQFSDSTEVTAIQIPVQVVADGKPVRGLAAADFVVYEGRRQRPVVGFDTVDLHTLPAGAEVPGAARRHFLMLFDLAFSDLGGIARARDAAIDMLDRLHATDLVAVATYRRTNGVDLVIGFTSDRDQVRAALDTLGLPELLDRVSDPLKLVVAGYEDNDFGDGEEGNFFGPGKERERERVRPPSSSGVRLAPWVRTSNRFSGLMDPLHKAQKEQEAAGRESQKTAVDAMTGSMAELARQLRSVSGRKEVLFFSEGFDSALFQGSAERAEQARMVEEGTEIGAIWRVDSEERFGSSQAMADLERMLEELRRADCRVHTIDTSGVRAAAEDLSGERTGGRDTLFQIARDTGGDLYENFNDLSVAVGKMLERTGVTYVLTIQPEDLKSDGSYHPLRVEVKRGKSPRGSRVVHRPGYFAPRHFAERGKMDRTLLTSSRLLSGTEPGTVATSVLATPFPKAGGTGRMAWVPVLIEADGPALLAGNGEGDLLAELYVYALDDKGTVHDYLAHSLVLELAKVEAELRRGGLRFLGHLELPPGRYSLRVMALNGRTGAYGLRTARVEVPETGAGRTVLLPPLFPEPPGRGVVTREALAEGQTEPPFPFVHGQVSYLPATRPVLEEGREAPLALVGYRFPAGELSVRTQVLTPDGREVGTGTLRVLGRETAGGPDGADRLRAAFLPPRIAPGEYLLRVTVAGEGAEQTSTTAFVVGNKG